MSKLSKVVSAVAIFAAFTGTAMAGVVHQSAGPVNYDSWSGWHNDELLGISLAPHTNRIDSLSGSSTTYDQGWGGNDFYGNKLYITLMDNGHSVWSDFFAGGARGATFQPYSISNDHLASLNAALAGIDWSSVQDVQMQVRSSTIGYPGWALHSQGAQFQVTSEVPEPASLAIIGMGLLGLTAARRKAAKK